ncbi:MAG TPA: PA14 domain-containing protein, partial [Kamptonema sp.]|nr:PA14 domain-containing protein [Kamptonema sp.]
GQKYDIKLEYFEGGSGAGVSLMWSSYSQGFEVIPTSQLSWSNNNVTLAVAPATVNENGTTNLVYTFTRTGDLTDSLTVNFNVGGFATFGSDYTQTGATSFSGTKGSVTFAANSSTATVTITPTTDSLVEPDETVELTLTEPTNYTIGTTAAVVGTITDSGTGFIFNKLKTNFSEVFGSDKVTRLDSQINFDWGGGSPDPLINSDYFVGQWSGLIQAPTTGQYTLFANSDDGVRLYFEDQLLVDDLTVRGWEEKSATVQMEAGKYYRIRLQYFEYHSGAGARLSWQPTGGTKQVIPEANLYSFNNSASAGSGTGLRATYYDNRDFTGTTVSRTDSMIAFDWAGGSPDPLIGGDDFSVRWQGKIEAQHTEKYSFHTISDDGVRLWVNNQLVIDDWNYHGYQIKNSGSIDLVAGQKYDIKLEYFEGGSGAGVSLMWSSYSQGFEVIPSSQLFMS